MNKKELLGQYFNELAETEFKKEFDTSDKDKEMLKKAIDKTKSSIPEDYNLLVSKHYKLPNIGTVYLLPKEKLYFVLSDMEEYPYEVYICSPYCEFATDEDMIVSVNGECWVLENIVRYVTDEIIKTSFYVGGIDLKDIASMKSGKIPDSKKGFRYGSDNSPSIIFRKNEIARSLFLSAYSVEELDNLENGFEEEVIVDIRNKQSEAEILSQKEFLAAASSFDSFVNVSFGSMYKSQDFIVFEFNDEFVGTNSTVKISNNLIFEGLLPKRLKLKTNINHIQELKGLVEISLYDYEE